MIPRRRLHLVPLLLALGLDTACGDDDGGGPPPDAPGAVDGAGGADGGGLIAARPYQLQVPAGLAAGTPAPLVILLHGYGSNPLDQELYFRLGSLVDGEGFLYATPEGTIDPYSNHFWNATDACCDLAGSGVDDVAYLNAVIDDVEARYTVDPARVYFVGHSNGGFMAHRMACDAAGRIAAIVSLAGAIWSDPSRCDPAGPVSVLQIHGTLDEVITYEGGTAAAAYPGAVATVASWAGKNGCGGALADSGETLDLEAALASAETRVARTDGCPGGGAAELWTIEGGRHVPALQHPAWETSLWAFLEAHPKP